MTKVAARHGTFSTLLARFRQRRDLSEVLVRRPQASATPGNALDYDALAAATFSAASTPCSARTLFTSA
jgi:hypothetical protein